MLSRKIQLLLVIIILSVLVIPSSAWLSGFDYKKEHTVSYSGTDTLNNYQMRLVFHNITGTDSGEDCYLGTHINQTDWDDLRITTTSDGICDMWIQEQGANYAVVWVEIPKIYPGSDNRLFIYYGKSLATSVSDGDATFRFWGTFEQVPLNVAKWAYTGNYTQYTDGGTTYVDVVRNATSGASRIYSLDTFSYATGYELIGKVRLDLYNSTFFGLTSGTKALYFRTDTTYSDMLYAQSSNVGGPTYTNLSNIYTGFQIYQVQRPPNGEYARFLINGSQVANHISDIPTTTMATDISALVVGSNTTCDWILVKRYVDPEPQHGVWDAETVETEPNARFEAEPRWGLPGTTVYFTDTSTGVVDSWSWDVDGDGAPDFTTKNCNITYNTLGYYDVTLTATNANGTSTETSSDYIYIYAAATPTPTPTNNMAEIVDVGAAGITGVMVTVFVYAVVFVGMMAGVFTIFNRLS